MTRALVVLCLALGLLAYVGGPSVFWFDPGARDTLHLLWNSSLVARAERVACLAGVIESDTVRVLRIRPLVATGGDSLGISANASLEACGPPEWQGTVHTHIALREGQRPYSLFSGADRGVMLMWGERWKATGIFCVLFSSEQAHCELDGIGGVLIFPTAQY
ncbi:MAG TPA: hypothetical protein VH763_16390 [Gemmatimonadales bacterium]